MLADPQMKSTPVDMNLDAGTFQFDPLLPFASDRYAEVRFPRVGHVLRDAIFRRLRCCRGLPGIAREWSG